MKLFKDNCVYEGSVSEIIQLKEHFDKQVKMHQVKEKNYVVSTNLIKCKHCHSINGELTKHVHYNAKVGKKFMTRFHCKDCDKYYYVYNTKEIVDTTRDINWIYSESYKKMISKHK